MVSNRVVLTVHNQNELEGVFDRYPADHYALVDDKSSMLVDVRRTYPAITTVLVWQGKYADPNVNPRPDIVLPGIRDATRISKEQYLSGEATSNSVPFR